MVENSKSLPGSFIFVGKENAPAASALLYNIVGQGQGFNNLRRFVHDAMENGGFEELRRKLSEI